ncbi:DMT family transporter [Aestuariivirga sp.]|uniref:DMT family transporter n=1 Tax=Aestuariivirga sp. TaxID=2650926 RepID=UPI0039189E1E
MSVEAQRGSNIRIWASLAVAGSGAMWGGFWLPLRWLEEQGLGGAWVSVIFFAVAAVSPLPWMLRRSAWEGFGTQLVNGALLGLAFTLYTVSLVLTDVINAILLFYLTPVWSTLAGIVLLGERLSLSRGLAMLFGFGGMVFILGFDHGLPLPRNAGDWLALLSGMLWAAGTLRSFLKPSRGVSLPVLTFCIGGLCGSGAVVALAALIGSPIAAIGNLGVGLPWAVLFALIFFVPPNFLVLWAAQRIDSGRVGILLMTEVLAGAVTAALFSGEPFGLMELAGTALILCAGLVEVLGRR